MTTLDQHDGNDMNTTTNNLIHSNIDDAYNVIDDNDDDDDDNAVDDMTDMQVNPSLFSSSSKSMTWRSSSKKMLRRFDSDADETKDEQNQTILLPRYDNYRMGNSSSSNSSSRGNSSSSAAVTNDDTMSVRQPADRIYLDTIDDDGEDADVLLIDTYLVCGEKAQCKEGVDVYDVVVNPAVMVTLDWDGSGISFIKVQLSYDDEADDDGDGEDDSDSDDDWKWGYK